MDVDLDVIGVTAGVAVVLLLLIRWLVPKYLRRFLRWVDEIIPADLSEFVRPVSRFFEIVLGLVVLLSAAFTFASQLGADLSGLLDVAGSGGAAVGRWLGIRALTIGLIAVAAITVVRVVNQVSAPLIKQWTVAGELRRRLKRAFDEEGIEIPFPHRTLTGAPMWRLVYAA